MVKSFISGASSQLRDLWKLLILLYIPIGLLFVMVEILSRVLEDKGLHFFLRDIVITGELPFFAGFVAQLTMILWAASLTICFFSLYLLKRQPGSSAGAKQLLLHAGILTLVLLIDDVFLFHEEIAPKYLFINEKIVVGSYGLLAVGFLFLNWKEILSSEYLILLTALVLFGTSILFDALPIADLNVRYFWVELGILIEDGSKFAGIATWLLYFARYVRQRILFLPPNNPLSA